jgi:hypothetical protein
MDYPGVSCEACAEALEVDGIKPDCRTGKKCLVPRLEPEAQRVMELRGLIVRLRDLVDAGTILKMCGADLEDLALLATVEDLLRESSADGERRQSDNSSK